MKHKIYCLLAVFFGAIYDYFAAKALLDKESIFEDRKKQLTEKELDRANAEAYLRLLKKRL